MQKNIIDCIRIAAAAENLTEAKRNAKAQGLSQAETARQYKRISERREAKRAFQAILRRKAASKLPKITMHDNINRRNFRRRAMLHTAKNQLMPFLWRPADYSLKISEGEALSIEYVSRYDGHYGGRFSHYQKLAWTISVTVPHDFMQHPIRVREIDGIPCLVLQQRTLPDGVTMYRANIVRPVRTEGFVGFEPCWIAQANGASYHAEDFKDAYRGLQRKLKRLGRAESVKLTLDSKITRAMYRNLTGACCLGVKQFCEDHGLENRKSITVRELLSIMPEGTFGKAVLQKAVQA